MPTYAGIHSVSHSANWIYIETTGLGSHVMGPWFLDEAKTQTFPKLPSNTGTTFRIPRNPAPATNTYTESTHAPEHSPILAWLSDGYPLYGPYGYTDPDDPNSTVTRMRSGYQKRDGSNGTDNLSVTGRIKLPVWAATAQGRNTDLPSNLYGPSTSSIAFGHYIEDYDHLGSLGLTQGVDYDLDIHNGRFCVTPEFPQGTYAYFVTIEADGTPKYPYNLGRTFYGNPTGGAVSGGISEQVTVEFQGGADSELRVIQAQFISRNNSSIIVMLNVPFNASTGPQTISLTFPGPGGQTGPTYTAENAFGFD